MGDQLKLFNTSENQSGASDPFRTTELTLKSRKPTETTPSNKPTEDHHTNPPLSTKTKNQTPMTLPSKPNLISLVPTSTVCSMESTRELSHQDSPLTPMISS